MPSASPVVERRPAHQAHLPSTTSPLPDDARRDVLFVLRCLRTMAKIQRETIAELRRINAITGHTDYSEHRAARNARNREARALAATSLLASDLTALYDPNARVRPFPAAPPPELSPAVAHSPGLAAAHHLIAVRVWNTREIRVWKLRATPYAARLADACHAAGHAAVAQGVQQVFGAGNASAGQGRGSA